MVTRLYCGSIRSGLIVFATIASLFVPNVSRASQSNATPAPSSTVLLAETAVATLPPPPSVVALARLTLAPGAEFSDVSVAGPELIAVESGTLTVTVAGEDEDAEEIAESVRRGSTPVPEASATPLDEFTFALAPGDSMSIPGDNGHTMRNLKDAPTVFLTAAVTAQPATGIESAWPPGSTNPMPDGLTIEPLDVGYDNATSTTVPARITLNRVTGVTGDFIPRSQASGPELLVVEEGALEVQVESGQVLKSDAASGQTEVVQTDESAATPTVLNVATTGSVLIQPGTISTVRAAGSGPVSLLTLTVLPL